MNTHNQPPDNVTARSSVKNACIIANAPGELDPVERGLVEAAGMIIAADGAIRKIPQHTRNAVVVGDFDSISSSVELPHITRISKPCQESSDIEKCIQYAIEQGVEKVKIVGAVGGRLDHSLVTIAMLVHYHQKLDISVHHNHSQTFACSSSGGASGVYEMYTSPHTPLSLISWGISSTVSLSGVVWPLEKFELVCGSKGVSNSSSGSSVLLQVHSGVVICVINASDIDREG